MLSILLKNIILLSTGKAQRGGVGGRGMYLIDEN